MLIRPEQREPFAANSWRDYTLRVCEHVRSRNLPACAGLTPAELHRRVRIGIARTRPYSLDLEWSIAAFVTLMFAISPAFDEHPAIAAILSDDTIEPNARVNELSNRVDDASWREAAEIPGESVWLPAVEDEWPPQ
jgi:hypothetical protein